MSGKLNFFENLALDKDFDALNCINRWNGSRVQRNETVAEHTYFVVLITRIMLETLFMDIENIPVKFYRECIDYALFHDFSEMFDRDVTHRLKYNPWNGEKIRECISVFVKNCAVEKYKKKKDLCTSEHCGNAVVVSNKFLANQFQEPKDFFVKDLVKLADWYSCIFYLVKEMMLGNKLMKEEFDYACQSFRKRAYAFTETYSPFDLGIKDWSIITDALDADFSKLILA